MADPIREAIDAAFARATEEARSKQERGQACAAAAAQWERERVARASAKLAADLSRMVDWDAVRDVFVEHVGEIANGTATALPVHLMPRDPCLEDMGGFRRLGWVWKRWRWSWRERWLVRFSQDAVATVLVRAVMHLGVRTVDEILVDAVRATLGDGVCLVPDGFYVDCPKRGWTPTRVLWHVDRLSWRRWCLRAGVELAVVVGQPLRH
jgi:hypothetical protein